jgi:hypothetical protein
MEPLDEYAFKIPHSCNLTLEVYRIARLTIDRLKTRPGPTLEAREQKLEDLVTCHELYCRRLNDLMTMVEQSLKDLLAYLPIWLNAIEKRRALMLTKNVDEMPEPPQRRPA